MRWRWGSASMTIGHGGHSCAGASYCRDGLQFSGSSGRAGPAGRAPGGLHFGHRRPIPLTRCHYAHYTGLSGQKGGYSYGCRSRVELCFLFSSLEYRDLVHIHPSTETEIERDFIYKKFCNNKSSIDTFSVNVSLNDGAKWNLLLCLKLFTGSNFEKILQCFSTFGEQLEILIQAHIFAILFTCCLHFLSFSNMSYLQIHPTLK